MPLVQVKLAEPDRPLVLASVNVVLVLRAPELAEQVFPLTVQFSVWLAQFTGGGAEQEAPVGLVNVPLLHVNVAEPVFPLVLLTLRVAL